MFNVRMTALKVRRARIIQWLKFPLTLPKAKKRGYACSSCCLTVNYLMSSTPRPTIANTLCGEDVFNVHLEDTLGGKVSLPSLKDSALRSMSNAI